MTAKRRLLELFVSLLVLCIIAYFLLVSMCFEYKEIVKVEDAGVDRTFFSGTLPGFYVLGEVGHSGFLSVKILEFRTGRSGSLKVIRGLKDEYILSVGDEIINVYLKQGKQIGRYRINGDSHRIVSNFITDLDNDNQDELMLVTGERDEEYGADLIVLSLGDKFEKNEPFKAEYKYTFKGLNPWKVQTADVDGDGKKEISLGVYKTAEFHPVLAKRPFLYNWSRTGLSPKWLGSRLARPFDDYIFSDIDGDGMEELVSIEILSNGEKAVNSYKWKGFGFEGIGESIGFQDISEIKKRQPTGSSTYEIAAKVQENGYWTWVALRYKDEKLVVDREVAGDYPDVLSIID